MRIEQLLEQLFIGWLDGPEEDLQPALERRCRLVLLRVRLQARWQGDLLGMNQLPLASRPQQFVAKLWVRDMNQSHSSFTDCFAVQLRHTVLGHDVVHVGPRSDYPSSRL